MDSAECHFSSLTCKLRIIEAKNIATKPNGVVFIRCYVSAGVRLESQQLPSESDVITWDQTFSLDCSSSIKRLKRETLVFELRWRSTSPPLICRIKGSKLIGRAEVPWNDVVESANMEIEKSVVMVTQNGAVKATALRVAVKILEAGRIEREKGYGGRWCEGCGCMNGTGCNSCVDYEFFCH